MAYFVGYVALGDFLYRAEGILVPNDLFVTVSCINKALVVPCSYDREVWSDSGSGANRDFGAWSTVSGQDYISDFFYGSEAHNVVPTVNAYCLKITSFFDISI